MTPDTNDLGVAERRSLLLSTDPERRPHRERLLVETMRAALSCDEFEGRRARALLRELGVAVQREAGGSSRAAA